MWNPDLSPMEFQKVLEAPIQWGMCFLHPPGEPHKALEPGLNPDAWYRDINGEYYIFIPWRKIASGTIFGQAIKAHGTHILVKNNIYPTHGSILDVGGYDGIWAWLFDAERKLVLDVCCEALERWAACHSKIMCEDARDLGRLIPYNFDVVFLLDVLEHMEEESAFNAILAAERIAKRQVIVATPDGYQPFDDWESIVTKGSDVPCAELMAHKSGWSHEFFEERGYKCIIQPDLHSDIGGGDGLVAFLNKE